MGSKERCFDCERPAIYKHHVVPKTFGGVVILPLCEFCHSKIHRNSALIDNKKKNIFGRPPFGYEVENGHRVTNESEQDTISIMSSLYNLDYSCKEISKVLNKKGYETRSHAKWGNGYIEAILGREGVYNESERVQMQKNGRLDLNWEENLSHCKEKGVCFDCGRPAVHNHHVVPKSLGGIRTVPLCEVCHDKAHGSAGGIIDSYFIKERRKKEGKIDGTVSFGYKIVNEQRVESEDEQDTISVICILHKRSYSCYEIAETLNRKGFETRSMMRSGHQAKWNISQVRVILKREGIYDPEIDKHADKRNIPYGCKVIHGEKVSLEEEQETIEVIHLLRKKGYSRKEVAKELNKRGYERRERAWSEETVSILLENLGCKRGAGNPPYGYTWGLEKFIPMESEQEIIEIVNSMFKGGFTKREVANRLNESGYRTREDRLWTNVSVFSSVVKIGRSKREGMRHGKTDAPFGYTYVYEGEERKIVSVIGEQKVLKLIKEFYANGYGCGRIIKELNRQGLTNRAGNVWKEKKAVRRLIGKKGFVKGCSKGRMSLELWKEEP